MAGGSCITGDSTCSVHSRFGHASARAKRSEQAEKASIELGLAKARFISTSDLHSHDAQKQLSDPEDVAVGM